NRHPRRPCSPPPARLDGPRRLTPLMKRVQAHVALFHSPGQSLHKPVGHTQHGTFRLNTKSVSFIKRNVLFLVRLKVSQGRSIVYMGTEGSHQSASDSPASKMSIDRNWTKMPVRLVRVTARPFSHPA